MSLPGTRKRSIAMAPHDFDRRAFLKSAASVAAGLSLPVGAYAAETGYDPDKPMPHRELGSTGEKVSMLCLGGHHIGRGHLNDDEAVALIRGAIDRGVTFMDNAWDYNGHRSEERMGRALQGGYREKCFLMTKHHGRKSKKMAMQHLEDSLRRLKTDVIDLWQFHEVVYSNDPAWIFSEGGAIEAAVEAKKQGKVRYIGFTGHRDPQILLDMLHQTFEWDAVQMPINALDPHYRSFIERVLPELRARGIGVLGMKTMAAGHMLDAVDIKPSEALRFAWSNYADTVVSGMDNLKMVEQNVATAQQFTPMSEQEQKALLARTREAGEAGQHEPFKTTRKYDGPMGRKLHGIEG
jgi:predicted aldo/keto reductase-like oxidoreductase